MLQFILTMWLGIPMDFNYQEYDTIYKENSVEIHQVLTYAIQQTSKLDTECFYEYGAQRDKNFIAVEGTCKYESKYYSVILVADYTGEDKYNWKRYWKKDFYNLQQLND